ncbi:aliphatic sulfonates ABC transporter substrate-binding protein, partial [Cylindrospermopsis raciborskii CS-506_A]|nr:aliphatic sulfonates ABC transporter substrate-binding protein [Cylindrospermopsis raciborskii CS-506_A]
IKERPQDVQALVNTWFETLDYIKANPEKSNEIMAKRAGVTVDEYKKYAEGTKIFSFEDNLQAFSSTSNIVSLKYTAQEIAKFLVEVKLAKKLPDLSQIFDDRFVKAYAAKQK